MTNARAEAFAPASMGNVGVGFDVLGLAFQKPGDTVIAAYRTDPGVIIDRIEGDDGRLPLDPARNSAAVAAQAVLNQLELHTTGIALTLIKDLPLASGLGSSAASAVAAAVAVNALLGEPLSRRELLPACLEGEACVSGYHADNVAPSLLGGITLICGTDADLVYPIPVPDHLHFALITPNVAVPTAEARAVLPQSIPLGAMVQQTSAVARLIDALHRGDIPAVGSAMEGDCVIEPARAHLMPKLNEVRQGAKHAGAFGVVISGAGPTLCAICDREDTAAKVLTAMQSVYSESGIQSVARQTQTCKDGARILHVE